MEFGLLLVPLLIAISGAIAYVGNLVGRSIGRRRLSLFGLRPRYTAQIITVGTGMLITLITLATVLLVSQDARTALFRFRALEAETQRLEREIIQARRRLNELKGGNIAYLRNQEVLRGLIDGRQPRPQIGAQVDTLRLRAVDLALQNGIGVDGATGSVLLLFPPSHTWDRVADLVQSHRGETIVRILANENALQGEPLQAYVQLIDNRLVYRRGTALVAGTVDGRKSRDEIGERLLELVDQASEQARGKIISSPFTRTTDASGRSTPPTPEVDVDAARRAVSEIIRARRIVRVEIVVARDAFTVGPLTVDFRLKR